MSEPKNVLNVQSLIEVLQSTAEVRAELAKPVMEKIRRLLALNDPYAGLRRQLVLGHLNNSKMPEELKNELRALTKSSRP